MPSSIHSRITKNKKTLSLFVASLQGNELTEGIIEAASEAFEKLSPFIKNKDQVLYIRDIRSLAIDERYPVGHCYNQYEAMIVVPSWDSSLATSQLKASINHELHHMARWQNAGYGNTLGGAILSEGFATYYEYQMSGWLPPWAQVSISKTMIKDALEEWDNQKYDHGGWFFGSHHERWTGYSLGYKLAKSIYKDEFNLADSVRITPDKAKAEFKKLLT
jgi:uncharacterized protein YjaZ